MTSLFALSPLDGRYAKKTEALRAFFSEYALIRFRLLIEIEWLLALAADKNIPHISPITVQNQEFLRNIFTNFEEKDAFTIKTIEAKINHDVKAVEYFLREKILQVDELKPLSNFIHFACTSEDINNLAYALMLKQARSLRLLPDMIKIYQTLQQKAQLYATIPMLGRTHGQAAIPTTLGKEWANVAARLHEQITKFEKLPLLGKCNGAIGNYSAHKIAFPEVDWPEFSQRFVENLGLVFNPYTTQIEPHDFVAAYMQGLKQFNTALIGFCSDMWSYISLGYFKQLQSTHEVGSSTMPHKINPIDFENAEGNLQFANTIFDHFSTFLPISRWQRDLRDSTLLRNMGVGIGHSVIAYQSLLGGLEKVEVDQQTIFEDLNGHWEILGEAIQTVLRCYDHEMPYEQLKTLTRGKQMDKAVLEKFIQTLVLPEVVKERLLALTPQNYLGYAEILAKKI